MLAIITSVHCIIHSISGMIVNAKLVIDVLNVFLMK